MKLSSGFIAGFVVSFAFACSANAADFCVSGLKGTTTSAYTFKVGHTNNSERSIVLFDANKNVLFQSKAENRFTQFNNSGYGVCSIFGSGTDATGLEYKLELKVAIHSKAECNAVDLPSTVEYLTLKVIPKGTTLGDDLTAYALALATCP